MEHPAPVKEISAVKWVEKKDNYYYAGLMYIPEIPKPKTEPQ
jgi:hypothetical protein